MLFAICVVISIHALRVEGDTSHNAFRNMRCNFYPRPPGGGRHGHNAVLAAKEVFLSTPSGWRATEVVEDAISFNAFLSTPSGWRATSMRASSFSPSTNFYPRPPGGGRQQKRTKFSSVFAQKGEEFASLRRGKRKICRWRFKKDKFWALIWCEGSGKSVCASASHCG